MRRARNSIRSPVFGRSRDALTILANHYGSDKGDRAHGRHCYAEIYDRLFCSKRLEPIAFLEIGLLHPLDTDGAATRAPIIADVERIFSACDSLISISTISAWSPSPTAPYSEVIRALREDLRNALRHHSRGRQPCIPSPADCSRDIVSIRCSLT